MIPADFHFLRPLWFIALLPLVWLLWRLWSTRSHNSGWQAVCDPQLLAALITRPSQRSSRWPLAALALAWLTATVALAGPTWSQLPQPVFRSEAARVVVLDLSRSMDATDISPSRLTQARFRLLDLLGASEEGQTGLIAFAGKPFVVSPLTDDSATVAALVPALETAIMPLAGTRSDLALLRAGELLDQAGAFNGEVLLIGDSAEPAAATVAAAAQLHSQGHRVSVLAMGTRGGAPIPQPEGGFVSDADGAIVLPKLDLATLQRVAATGGGQLIDGSRGSAAINAVLDTPLLIGEHASSATPLTADRWRDEGAWLVLALLPLAALGFRRGWFGVALLGVGLGLQLLPAGELAAAEAQVDRHVLHMDETLNLTVSVSGSYQGNPDLSALDTDFERLGTSRSARISIVNGDKTAHTEWHVTLAPRRVGELTIPVLTVGGEQTAAITLQVQAANAEAQDDFKVELLAEPESPYVQQQTLLILRIFYTDGFQSGSVGEPEVGDAPLLRLGEDREYGSRRNGIAYNVIERRYALFPQHSGPLTIPPLTFSGQVREPQRGSSFSRNLPFGRMFAQTRTVRRRSAPLELDVRPRADLAELSGLPDPATPWLPAAGMNLTEAWEPNPPQFRVGEPITRTISLSAAGLTAAQLPDLAIATNDGLRIYADKPLLENSADSATITGQRIVKAALVPQAAGPLTLPEVELQWWDTSSDKRRTLVLPARQIEVQPGDTSISAATSALRSTDSAATPGSDGSAPHPPSGPSLTTKFSAVMSGWLDQLAAPQLQPAHFDLFDIALTLLWLLTVLLWLRERRRRRQAQNALAALDPQASPRTKSNPRPTSANRRRQAAAAVRKACQRSDAAAAQAALLDWARSGQAADSAGPTNLGQLADAVSAGSSEQGQTTAAAVRDIDHAIYRGGAWDGKQAAKALATMLDQPPPAIHPDHRSPTAPSALPALYP